MWCVGGHRSPISGMWVISPGRALRGGGDAPRTALSPLPRTPDWAGSLPLLLQLHGLSCCVCSPGASAEAAPAGRLCSGCGTLPASAPAPHGPQALRQPSPLCAFGASRGLRGSPVLLTHAPMNSHGLPSPSPSRGTAGEELAGVPEISGIFVGD